MEEDFGYEVGPDDIRESKQSESMFTEKSTMFTEKSTESEECKILRKMLKQLNGKLKLLEAKCSKPDEFFFATAETMKKILDEILKLKDQREEENVGYGDTEKANLKDGESQIHG